MTEAELWVVKRRVFIDGVEMTSVIMSPDLKHVAQAYVAELNRDYQDPGNYYIERWNKK